MLPYIISKNNQESDSFLKEEDFLKTKTRSEVKNRMKIKESNHIDMNDLEEVKEEKISCLFWNKKRQVFIRETAFSKKNLELNIFEDALMLYFARCSIPLLKRPLIDLILVNQIIYFKNMFYPEKEK